MASAETSLFERSVAARPLGDGRYAARVDAAWTGPAAPNGGVIAAAMLRAAQAELGSPAPPPRTIAVQYLEAPEAREVTLAVTVLRRGKRVAVCDVRMDQDERLVCQATVICSSTRADAITLRRRAPQVPPPAELDELDGRAIPLAPRVFQSLRLWPTFGGVPFAGSGEAITGGWIALRGDDGPLDAARLCALCDLWWPAVFPVLSTPAGVPTIQLTVYFRAIEPVLDGPVLARFTSETIAEGHIEENGELWSADGILLAESRQLSLLLPLPG